MNNEGVYIPRRLDDQWKLGMWDIDVALSTVIGVVLGMMKGTFLSMGICTVVGLLISWKIAKIKASQHPGYAMHALYWYVPNLLALNSFRKLPESSVREMVG
jgi:conjugal transfer pilus assembly protein TraL